MHQDQCSTFFPLPMGAATLAVNGWLSLVASLREFTNGQPATMYWKQRHGLSTSTWGKIEWSSFQHMILSGHISLRRKCNAGTSELWHNALAAKLH